MLIRHAEVWQQGIADVRVSGSAIVEVGTLMPISSEIVLDARGGALLPGLHDHHIHLAALAVAHSSVQCGAPYVTDEASLAHALASTGEGWLRGIGYHESTAGMLEKSQLDRLAPHRPVRIQHRSGRMWFFNSLALSQLLDRADPPPGLERNGGEWTGRLFDEDRWLQITLQSSPPGFAGVSGQLARMGVTGLTDMSPANDSNVAAHFASEQATGGLLQRCVLAGALDLVDGIFDARLCLGPAKLHLHENALPDIDDTVAFVRAAHAQGRPTATHCTTETELVFALAALRAAGTVLGDRIEHAGVVPDALLTEIARMELQVVSQPHFISENGDRYLRDVEQSSQPFLYRLASFKRVDVVLAAGSDAPFASHDPWVAMRAAVSRRTLSNAVIGSAEALTPEAAVELYLADPLKLAEARKIEPGAPADLCLLDRPWEEIRIRLDAQDVRATMIAGSIVYNRVDQTPV